MSKICLSIKDAAWCDMVRLELWNGVRDDAERTALSKLDDTLPRLPISAVLWDAAVGLASKARAAGVTVPTGDLLIFACAKHYGVEIAHVDRHFDLLERLK